MDHIEVYNNQDDGFEWFGGTVRTSHLVSAFNGDDSFDYDQGFDGQGQFWFTIQKNSVGVGDRAGEHDGGDTQEDATPYATPEIYNATYIGGGVGVGEDQTFKIRDNAGGHYANSAFTQFGTIAIEVEDLDSGEDSRARLEAGDLTLEHNHWYGCGAGDTWGDIAPQSFVADYLENQAAGNVIEGLSLRGISRTANGGLDPRPTSDSPLMSGTTTEVPDNGFFVQTDYRGAFGTDNWMKGWTFLDEAGYLQ